MANFIHIKRGELYRSINRIYRLHLNGLIKEERNLLMPIESTMFTKDMGYLLILLSGIYKLPNMAKGRDNKRIISNKATIYTANMDVILSFYVDRYFTKIKRPLSVKKAFKVASMYYPQKASVFEILIEKFIIESQRYNREIDDMSNIVGNIFKELFSWKDDEYKEDLENLGYCLGRYFYISRTYKSLKKDEKKGNYNPLIFTKKKDPESFDIYLNQTLKSQANACMEAFERLPIKEYGPIIKNALYVGLLKEME